MVRRGKVIVTKFPVARERPCGKQRERKTEEEQRECWVQFKRMKKKRFTKAMQIQIQIQIPSSSLPQTSTDFYTFIHNG